MNIHDTLPSIASGIPEDILRRKLHGDFSGAIRLIDQRLSDAHLPQAMRGNLEIQKNICQRLPAEFPYSIPQALSIIQQDIPDFTEEELYRYMDQGFIRWIYIDGQEHIFNRFYSSLIKAAPGFAKRAGQILPGVESAVGGTVAQDRLDLVMEKMKRDGVVTNRIQIRATVKLKDVHFKPGMFLRVHLPVPKACQQQSEIRIEKIWPEDGMVSPEDASQRTVCWEVTLQENTEFGVEYSYLHTAVYQDLYGKTGLCGTYDFDVHEQSPHVVFSPEIRSLCNELTQGIQDPLGKAQAFYDFITRNMHYTYMPDYALLEDIAANCARNYTGDCGVFALLFLTLCRCAGIPAQWQSGLTAEPDFIGGHDWVRFYVEPYGWIFADPSYGTGAVRNGKEDRRQFYFGNLDAYRMVANSAFQENFTVPKEHWRADPYDNQVGEIETADHGFPYEDYIRTKEILECTEI